MCSESDYDCMENEKKMMQLFKIGNSQTNEL